MTPVYNLKTNIQSYGQTVKMCKLLLEADSYFKGKDVNTQKINEKSTIKGYCSSDSCKTNEERINALTVYIYMEFKKLIRITDYNTYDECLLMWISDKLFRIHDKSNPKKVKTRYIDTITLNSAYEKYLKDHKVKLKYWELFDSIKGLKEANLRYMAEFYKLLNRICKTIGDYKNNGAGSNNLSKYSKNCLTQYRSLYLSISECDSYLRLLNKLKGIYDDFRVSAIKENSSNINLAIKLQTLTTPNGEEMDAVKGFKQYKITKKRCYSQKKKADPPPSSQKSQGGSNGQDPPNISDSSKKNTGGGGNGGDVNPGDGSNGPTSSTSEGSFDWGSSIFKFILNGTENLKKTSEFIDQNQKKIKEVTDKIINVYNGAMDDLKKVYDKSNKYLNNFISNVTSHLNSIGAPSKPDGNPSEPEKSINGGDSPSQLPSNSPTPQTSQITQNSKEQTTTQQSPQGTSGNQSSDQKDQGESKIQVETPVIKQENSGTKIKGNETTGIGDIYVLKKYKKLGTSIIVLLIPITLAIMYKYLSFGRRKELKKKTNMKKVINSIGGKKQIQIIIKSSNQKKNTKKSINSVYKEKSPLLNVYKLMQADPVPFINLFFLLIFFVYKRKENSLE
ncbi:CIR protein PIR protein [Plasmodium vinckei vinckei]|uniref:CIR protein PIR protein n=1 Tax=Plasmodium vinckei vinckei TaxID=54757 RepID=A0A449BND4_PLAVN|nr:CIR protein PIR protein [Plasmodium vinckei vinckei]VEV54908.1 CIR protein PIR protein [Plasmodium vinckei vinckei]